MEIVVTESAQQSLDRNLEFSLVQQGIPFLKVYEIQESIFEKIRMLANNPLLGQMEEFITHSTNKTYRRLVDGNYKIIYYVSGDTIFITDIFDSRQDPQKMKG